MQNIHQIAVLGGTGKSGKYVVQELLKRGYRLKLLLRHPENFTATNPNIQTVKGDARSGADIFTLLQGCDAVVSTLGQPKGEPSIFSAATGNVLHAMQTLGIRRYIVTTGLSVDAPGDRKSAQTQAGTEWMKTHYPETTFDKQREFELLQNSSADWTMVRLPLIELTDETPPVKVDLENCPGNGISATSLAHFVATQLNNDSYVRQAPFIANA